MESKRMACTAVFFLILVYSSWGQGLESDRKWVKLEKEKAGFQVWSPGPMAEKLDTLSTGIGTLVYHTFFYRGEGESQENFVYMVSYCDYPEGSIHSDSTELLNDFFEATVESAAFSIAGDLVYVDDITLDEYPGRLWRINYLNDQAMIRTKAFLVKNRYFAIQTVTLKELSLNPASDRFLDSFQLLDPN